MQFLASNRLLSSHELCLIWSSLLSKNTLCSMKGTYGRWFRLVLITVLAYMGAYAWKWKMRVANIKLSEWPLQNPRLDLAPRRTWPRGVIWRRYWRLNWVRLGEVAFTPLLTDHPKDNRAGASDPKQWKWQYSNCCVLIHRRHITTGDLQKTSLIKSRNLSASHLKCATGGARPQVVEHRRTGAKCKKEDWRC